MTSDRGAIWLGFDTVVLRGASVRRVFAAMELEARAAARNGRTLPPDVQWDLAVLRAAAEAARGQMKAATDPPADQVGFAGEPVGFAGSPSRVSPPHPELMDASQVAAALHVTPQYARRLCRTRRLRTAHQVGRVWLVSAAEVAAFARSRTKEAS